ncbi:DUF4214 domain-containing protein [Thiorhodovibrio winogradskyi]|uniref:DUF4214 domain-containing protein n=1 Tax=Thiorhodovibrio winogradskyi TaxID=77007 RepID=UPI002E2B4424|nr:DUF4214 domain-containing protein [Thiorhodovibrio winogradskyi]
MEFWTEQWFNPASIYYQDYDAIASAFVASTEFAQRYGSNLTDADFVSQLYRNMLGREPEEGGLDFWTEQLAAGRSRGEILTDFAFSPENQANFANQQFVDSADSFIAATNAGETPDDWLVGNPSLDPGKEVPNQNTFTLTEKVVTSSTYALDGIDFTSLQEMLAYAAEYRNLTAQDQPESAAGGLNINVDEDVACCFDTEFLWQIEQLAEDVDTAIGGNSDTADDGIINTVNFLPAHLTTSRANEAVMEAGLTGDMDNIIIAGTPYPLHQAYINGGGGYNVLEVDMKGPFAQPKQLYNIQEIRVQNLTNYYDVDGDDYDNLLINVFDGAVDSIFDVSRARDLVRLVITESGSDGALTLLGVQNYATARFEGNFEQDVTLHYGAGQGDELQLEMANVTSTGVIGIAHNVGALEIFSEGRSNVLENVNFGTYFQQLTVTGTALLAIEGDLNFAWGEAYIDASENTGGLRVNVADLGDDGLDTVVIMGSQANDAIELEGVNDGALVNINTNTGNDRLTITEGLSAGAGSVLTGENLTVTVEADADLRLADISGVARFVISADGGLLLTQAQVQALGAAVFAADHNDIPVLSIEVSEAGTVLSDLIDLTALDSDVKLAFNVLAGASLDLTAEELHTYVANNGIVGEGVVNLTEVGLGFDPENVAGIVIGEGVGTIDPDFEGTLNVTRTADGFERPVAAADTDILLIDTTDTGGVTVNANDLQDIVDDEDEFSTLAETVVIKGSDDITFNVPVEMLADGFSLDFSELTGGLNDLTIDKFNNVAEVIGNGAGERIDVMLEGDVAEEGADTGLLTSGVATYVVVDIDDSENDDGDDDEDTVSFHLCDNTQGVTTIGLQGNMGKTLTFTNVPWGAVNPTILFEGDGYGNWDELPKAAGNPDESNVGTIVTEYFFDGAPARVLMNNQGNAPGQTSTGEPRPIAVDSITLDNAKSVEITIEDGNGIIYNLTDNGSGEGLEDVTIISGADVTLHLDGQERANDPDGDWFDSIDASAVDGTMTLHVEGDVDFSGTELTGIESVVLEDGVTVTMTIAQINDIGVANIMVENEDDEATLNIGEYDGSAFDFSSLEMDGIEVDTVTFVADMDITVDATTDFTGIDVLVVPEGTNVVISAVQFKQLVEGGATIVTEGVPGDDDQGTVTVDLDGDLEIGADDLATMLNGLDRANLTFAMADGETLDVSSFALADGLQVTGEDGAATTPLVNFSFDSPLDNDARFNDTIDVAGYGTQPEDGPGPAVDLRIQDSLLNNFWIDADNNGIEGADENSQSIEDLLENLESANILNIYRDEVDEELDPRDRDVVVESNAVPEGIEFSAEGALADYVRSIDLTLEADADNSASIDGDLLVNDGLVEENFTLLTIHTVDTDGAAADPVTINGDIYSEGDDGAGNDGDLLTATINAAVDLVMSGSLIFSALEAGGEATLKVAGDADVTMKSVDAGFNVAAVTFDTAGYTGTLTLTGGSDAIEMGDAASLVFSGSGDIVLDTDDGAGNNGIEGDDLTSIDASEHTGSLTLSVIESVSETDFTFTTGTGTTTATLSAILEADPDADPAEPGWSLNVGANTTLTLSGSTFNSGALAIAGAGTVVFDGDGNEVDLTGLVDVDGNSLLNFSSDTTIELAPDTQLSLTAEQLNDLNEAGVTFTKQPFDEGEGETEAVITVTGVNGDLTAANEDLDEDLDLTQADELVLSGDATLTGEQVSGREVTGNFNLTLTEVTADTDLTGVDVGGDLIVQAGDAETELTLAATAISGITMTVQGAALGVLTVSGVEDVVIAEGEANEGDIDADFSNLTVDLFDDDDPATDEEVVFELDSTGDQHLNGADFGALLGHGTRWLDISGTGTVTEENEELTTGGSIEIGENATVSVTAERLNVGGVAAAVDAGEGRLEVNDLGAAVVTVDTDIAFENVNYEMTFTDQAGTELVTIQNFTADSATAQDILNFSAALPEGADHDMTKLESLISTVNQTGSNSIVVLAIEDGGALQTVDSAAQLATALTDGGVFVDGVTANFGFDGTRIFMAEDAAGNTDVYLWEDSVGGDGVVQDGELSSVATIEAVGVASFVDGNFAIA